MQYCTGMCGDTPLKWLVKVTMGSAYSFLIALLCIACSREQEEVYQDPYADPNVKVGQQASEQIEPADKHEGQYSFHKYEFKGKGPAHKMADVKKYDLDHMGNRGSDVSVKVHIEQSWLAIRFLIRQVKFLQRMTGALRKYHHTLYIQTAYMAKISFRMDNDLNAAAESTFKGMGMDLSTAIIVFVPQAVKQQRLPFSSIEAPLPDTTSLLRMM